MKARDNRGFTLIELLIVIGIIAILAAIAIPQFAEHRKRAVEASMLSDVRNATMAAILIHTEHRTWAGLAPGTGTGPRTVNWSVTGATNAATSPLSAGNVITAPTGTLNAFEICVTGAGRSGREAVAMDEDGAIGWGLNCAAAL